MSMTDTPDKPAHSSSPEISESAASKTSKAGEVENTPADAVYLVASDTSPDAVFLEASEVSSDVMLVAASSGDNSGATEKPDHVRGELALLRMEVGRMRKDLDSLIRAVSSLGPAK